MEEVRKTLILLILFFLGIGFFCAYMVIRSEKKEKKEIETYLQQANEALNQGSYSDAYVIVDKMISKGYSYKKTAWNLNKKVLTYEIATITEENEDNSAPKLLFAIKERAKYNADTDYEEREEKDMLKYAIGLVTTMGYEQTASLLQNALDQYANDEDDENDENDENDDEE